MISVYIKYGHTNTAKGMSFMYVCINVCMYEHGTHDTAQLYQMIFFYNVCCHLHIKIYNS